MRQTEWVQLVAYIKMRSPQTYIVEGTSEAWYADVAEYDARAVQQAVDTLSRRPGNLPIALGDLLVEIRKVRALRLEKHGDPVIMADPDDKKAWQDELARARKAIADGEPWPMHPFGELTPRPVDALVVGRPIPMDNPARVEVRDRLRAAAHGKREATEAEVAAANAEREARAKARAEIEALKAKARGREQETPADA